MSWFTTRGSHSSTPMHRSTLITTAASRGMRRSTERSDAMLARAPESARGTRNAFALQYAILPHQPTEKKRIKTLRVLGRETHSAHPHRDDDARVTLPHSHAPSTRATRRTTRATFTTNDAVLTFIKTCESSITFPASPSTCTPSPRRWRSPRARCRCPSRWPPRSRRTCPWRAQVGSGPYSPDPRTHRHDTF